MTAGAVTATAPGGGATPTTAETSGTAASPLVPFASCLISSEARQRAAAVLANGWLTTGPECARFEGELADWIGAREVVSVSSCTAALELSLRSLGLPPGARVLTPTLTFCGAVAVIRHAGLVPALVDTDEATLTVSPQAVAAAAAWARPAAMIVQHMAGYPAPPLELAEAAGLSPERVIEDAAHGLGTWVDTVPVGQESHAGCFSFYATKNLPIGEGGAIATDDSELAARLRSLRLHGMSKSAWTRYQPGGSWRYDVADGGLKANLTDLAAALGIGQLAHLDRWQQRRGELAARYDAALVDIPGIVRPPRPPRGRHAWHLYIIRVTAEYGRTRDDLAAALAEAGVGTSVHFIPVHHFASFGAFLHPDQPGLPHADRLFPQLLSLPLHPALSDVQVDQVSALLAAFARPIGGR